MARIDVSRIQNILRVRAYDAVLVGTDKTRSDISRNSPVRTGALQEAFTQEVAQGGSRIVARISNPRPYAEYVTEGTRPHTITAVNRKALSFYWPAVSARVAFKSVNHPGTAPNPFWKDGLEVWPDNIREQF